MTTRCLIAFDYADWRAQNVLRKHAKKRPLGDIESKHRYRPAQPVLSCRTVDVDLSGTRTYRAKSTTDIISEQHRYIHDLYNKARNIASAPPRRLQSASRYSQNENYQKLHKLNIEVSGRPFSSLSQTNKVQTKRKGVTSAKRPKTTGQIKNVKSATDSYMVVKVDPDFLETSRSQREITEQIHQHWLPENNNLNQGRFVKGQKKPESVPTSIDAWLTFGGAPGDADNGVVDAFASYRSDEEYYNIDGSVGSKVAQQLQRGDKIRIGINGVVKSHDLKVRKRSAVSQEETPRKEVEKEEDKEKEHKEMMNTDGEVEKPEEEEFDFMAELNTDLMTQDLDQLIEEEEETVVKLTPVIPLSWTDQISKDGVKVLSPRCAPVKKEKPNLCETRPVVFERLVAEDNPSTRPWAPRQDGYQVKYRQRPQLHGLDSRESRLNRVKVISIDPRSKEDEDKLNNISVDEILKSAVEKKSSQSQERKTSGEKVRKTDGKKDEDSKSSHPAQINGNMTESILPQSSDQSRKRVSIQSHAPSTTVQDLSIVTPGAKHKTSDTRGNKTSGKAVFGKSLIRSPLGGSGPSIKAGNSVQGETEYIQIASQLRVPGNSPQHPVMAYTHQLVGSQDRVTSPERPYSKTGLQTDHDRLGEDLSFVTEEVEVGGAVPSLASPEPKSPVPALEISIPTAEDSSDRDSLLPSPQRPGSYPDEADELTNRQRREVSMRDAQIDQIASMLGGALIQE